MRTILLLSLLTAFGAMSTDMYLPALPTIQKTWGLTMAQANLTLIVFFTANPAMILVYGPLSDRIGRRPTLFIGLVLFLVGCLGCALAPTISLLVAARAVQATGAASATTLSFAIARDLFEGPERQRVLGYVGVIFALVPMLAPSIGGWMLTFSSWRWIFGVQAFMCLVALLGVWQMEEPLKKTMKGGPLTVARRYLVVLTNGRFVVLTVLFALMVLPLFGYIGGAAEIYINEFSISPQEFGVHFGIIAGGIMAGSMFAARQAGKMSNMRLLSISMGGMLAAAIVLNLVPVTHHYLLTAIMFCNMLCIGINRPLSTHMILDVVNEDIGAASSLMTFSMMLMGAVPMAIIAMEWGSRVPVLAVFMLFGSAVPILGFTLLRRHDRNKESTQAP